MFMSALKKCVALLNTPFQVSARYVSMLPGNPVLYANVEPGKIIKSPDSGSICTS